MAKFDPFLSLDCARVEGVERKGSNFAIWQHWHGGVSDKEYELPRESGRTVKDSPVTNYHLKMNSAHKHNENIEKRNEISICN